jgi:GNAT superfamily N-acetyltransferase
MTDNSLTDPTTATIRAATLDDVAELGRGLERLAESLGEPAQFKVDLAALARYGFGERPAYHALIAEGGDRLLGFCVYLPEFSTWRCRPGLYVQDLFVESQQRGRGIGRALLSQAMNHARHLWQADYLRLAVHVMNHDARRFYHKLGFVSDADNQVMLLTGNRFSDMIANHS